MIIFDLDHCLANSEHRMHFVDIYAAIKCGYIPAYNMPEPYLTDENRGCAFHPITKEKWIPNWKEFNENCHLDPPIHPLVEIFNLLFHYETVFIWSGRCESVKSKTISWIESWCGVSLDRHFIKNRFKMRSESDSTPIEVLKEKWLIEAISRGRKIECVFDGNSKCIKMWRHCGIFAINCSQQD